MNEPHSIYLDHNATTPVLPEVVDAMLPYLREHFGNPSSGYSRGRRARSAVEAARAQVAELLACAPNEVVFTSGGTEANNLAIRGVAAAAPRGKIVTSVIEHPATERPCAWLAAHGREVERLPVDEDGRVRPTDLEGALASPTTLVTLMHSNNETGVLQPVKEVARLSKAVGAVVHTDAAQSVGKVAVRVNELGVDLLSIAGHKLYAPKGIGALFIRRGTPIEPLLLGAGQERALRPGTENVPYIVGLGVACDIARRDLDEMSARVARLRDRLWEGLSASVPGLALNGHRELRLPNTLNVRFPGASGTAVLADAPEIAASTGAACHEGVEAASAVIVAMGVSPDDALGSVRLSLGRETAEDDVERAVVALSEAWRRVAR